MSTRQPPQISIQLLNYVADWLVAHGVSIATCLAEAEVAASWLGDNDRLIPLVGYVHFFERAAAAANMPHLGLRLGQFDDVGSLGALGHLFMTASSLLDAFADFTSHLHALQEGTTNRLSMSGSSIQVDYRIDDNGIVHRRQDAEYSISATNQLVNLYSAGRIRPKEVYFEHRQAGSYETYRAHFGCDIFFEQPCNALVYDREGFNVRSTMRNSVLGPIIASHLGTLMERRSPGQGIVPQVLQLIDHGLADAHLSQHGVALKLGISVATLGRRLKMERQSFRMMVTARRLAVAERLLLIDDRPICEIALAVGYGENASFTRAFRQRNGVSPRQFRRAARRHSGVIDPG